MRILRSISRTERHVAVVSDVHLRAPWDSVTFGAEWARLRTTVETLKRSGHLVVLNGDIFDLDRGKMPLSHDAKARAMPRSLIDQLQAWQADNVILLTGNHELWAGDALGAATAVDLPWGAAHRLRIEHGERFDGWAKRVRPFTAIVTWVSGLVERGSLRPLLRGMRSVERALSNGSAEHEAFVNRIVRWLGDNPEYRAFAFGHTHRAGVWSDNGLVVANAGEFRGDAATLLLLDTNATTARVVSIDELQQTLQELLGT